MDMELVKVKDLVPLVEMNTTAAREHMGVIENKIRHMKEKVRATIRKYPFKWTSVMVLIHTVYFCVF